MRDVMQLELFAREYMELFIYVLHALTTRDVAALAGVCSAMAVCRAYPACVHARAMAPVLRAVCTMRYRIIQRYMYYWAPDSTVYEIRRENLAVSVRDATVYAAYTFEQRTHTGRYTEVMVFTRTRDDVLTVESEIKWRHGGGKFRYGWTHEINTQDAWTVARVRLLHVLSCIDMYIGKIERDALACTCKSVRAGITGA